MLLGVFSDAHGATGPFRGLIEQHHPDQVIFLGDGVRDAEKMAEAFPKIPFQIVCGNCDWGITGYPDSLLFELEGVRIFAAHGHRYNVKTSIDGFLNSVCCSGAQLGLFGHTHRALLTTFPGNIQLLNPGSVGDRFRPTCGLVTLSDGTYQTRIVQWKP